MADLFAPFQKGKLNFKNHFARAATKEQICSPGGHIPQEVYDFYEELAKGGVGTIIVSSARVKLFNGTNPQGLMRLDRHDLLPEYKKLADIGHKYGCTMIVQESFSKVKNINEMTELDFERCVNLHAEAAKFVQDAGFDGVELHEAHGTLMFLGTALKPGTNHRSDVYGTDRDLLMTKIIKKIREYTGPDFIIMAKEDMEDLVNGYTLEMAIDHCKRLEEAGLDLIEVSGANAAGTDSKYDVCYFRDYAIELKKHVQIPVMLVGGNKDLDLLEELHDQHGIDLFSMSRLLTREFDLINRWQNGDRTPSKCISCGACNKTFAHVCPFNKENPFDFRRKPLYDMSGKPLKAEKE